MISFFPSKKSLLDGDDEKDVPIFLEELLIARIAKRPTQKRKKKENLSLPPLEVNLWAGNIGLGAFTQSFSLKNWHLSNIFVHFHNYFSTEKETKTGENGAIWENGLEDKGFLGLVCV